MTLSSGATRAPAPGSIGERVNLPQLDAQMFISKKLIFMFFSLYDQPVKFLLDRSQRIVKLLTRIVHSGGQCATSLRATATLCGGYQFVLCPAGLCDRSPKFTGATPNFSSPTKNIWLFHTGRLLPRVHRLPSDPDRLQPVLLVA